MMFDGVEVKQFAHLHVHSDHSILDGAAPVAPLVARAADLGQPGLALTDHGSLSGTYAFFQAAQKAGITPVVGLEAYVAPQHRSHKEPVFWGTPEQKSDDVSGGGRYTHLTLLAYNNTGLHNLIQLSSRAYTEGRVGKWGRLDHELMDQYSDGLIATSGCPSGAVQTRLRLGQEAEARAEVERLVDIFGPENFYLEYMSHNLDLEKRTRAGLDKLAADTGLNTLATNDSHYVDATDAATHDMLLCINTGSRLDDPTRFKFNGTGYHVRSAEEMRRLDSSEEWRLGMANTLAVVEQVDTTGMFEHVDLMPRAKLPEGVTAEAHLRQLAAAGFAEMCPQTDAYRERLEYELQVIEMTGYASYFLFTADFVSFARRRRIQVGCRGSGAASLVGYCLGITDADPVKYDLVFERLLNPERQSMPDYDIDVEDGRREEVINYLRQEYGEAHVAHINTFGTIKARAAIKDAARVMNKPYALGAQMTRLVPPLLMGRDVSLAEMYDKKHARYGEAAEFRKLADSDPDARDVVIAARDLEGMIRSTGVHAAGMIVSPEPIADHVPLMQTADGTVKIQYDYPTAEALGLVKVDLLGLKTLTVVANAIRHVPGGVDLQTLSEDDKATFELLRAGDTLGCFQLDSGPIRALLRSLEPESIDDLSAVVALYRPGPMSMNTHMEYADRKNGRKPIRPIHEELADPLDAALGRTYGLLVYQESVLKAAQVVAGYSLGRADVLRKAVGKKRVDVMEAERETFAAGMRANGYGDAAIKALWDTIVGFADYGFNKSHAVMYGILAYRTAYLKAHHPAEFMAALLTSEAADPNKRAVYLAECRRMGLRVMVPDVNASGAEFTPHDGAVRFGLASVRNVGASVVEGILAAREVGPFASFPDYLERVTPAGRNKRVVESLIQAGAFDSFGDTRNDLMHSAAGLTKSINKVQKKAEQGQSVLFDTDEQVVQSGTEWTDQFKLTAERDMLGLYVSSHPLRSLVPLLEEKTEVSIPQILTDEEGYGQDAPVLFGGLISAIDMKVNQQQKAWCIATIEDLDASIEVLVFARDYMTFAPLLRLDGTVVVRGRVDLREGAARIVAVHISALEES